MNKKATLQLAKLVARCEASLRDKSQQSLTIFRGDMWAVVGAQHELSRKEPSAPRRAKVPAATDTP